MNVSANIKGTHTSVFKKNIEQLVKPLSMIGITYFHYAKRFKDNSCILLTNNPQFDEYFFHEGLCPWTLHLGRPIDDFSEIESFWQHEMVMTDKMQLKINSYVREEGFHSGLIFTRPQKDAIEIFTFASDDMELYTRDIKLFNKFADYFQLKASHLIREAHADIHKNLVGVDCKARRRKTGNHLSSEQKFASSLMDKSDPLETGKMISYLTTREKQCYSLRLQGFTSKTIANYLAISKRTVDCHFDSINQKLRTIRGSRLIYNQLITEVLNMSIDYAD